MTTDTLNPRSWLYPTARGLYCEPGDFYVDPGVAVPRAVITHGHVDHALPVFHPPSDAGEIGKLLRPPATFPERTHMVGVYALGECQRVIKLLRAAGYDQRIWLHGGLASLCKLYQDHGVDLGDIALVSDAVLETFKGAIVLCPPSAIADRWSRRFFEPIASMASGWMGIRARARQRGAELPLIISDHADWSELTQTLKDVGAPKG